MEKTNKTKLQWAAENGYSYLTVDSDNNIIGYGLCRSTLVSHAEPGQKIMTIKQYKNLIKED